MMYKRTESKDLNRYAIYEITDDSMAPQIQEGDEVQIDTQAENNNGDYVVAIIEDGSTVLRKMNKHDEDYIFTATNAAYEPILCSSPTIVGKAIRVYRKV